MTTLEEAANLINSGDRVFVHGGMMTPRSILDHIVARHKELKNVEFVHIHTTGDAPYTNPEFSRSFRVSNLFSGANVRKADNATYIPTNLSMIPQMFRDGTLPLDVAIVKVSPPVFGQYSLGLSVDCAYAAALYAKTVIGIVDNDVPHTYGPLLGETMFDMLVECNEGLPVLDAAQATPEQEAIGKLVASQIDDGSTIQLGIGGTSSVVAKHLTHKRGLKVWSEMIADPVVDLLASGAVDHVATSFAEGSRRLVDAVTDSRVTFKTCDVTNDFRNIVAKNKFVSINNIVSADLYGNTVCDSIGTKHYSGIGGQLDFAHAALYSAGGQGFLCLKSQTRKGIKTIVNPGALKTAATVPMHLVDNIVTEKGIAKLRGKTLEQRLSEMRRIA